MAHTFIIAEAGVNHNGDIQLAKEMILAAKNAGVDAIKFQTFQSEKVVSKFAPKAEYQKDTTNRLESQLDMVKKLELSYESFRALKKFCEEIKILFLSTPFDQESIIFLNNLGVPIFKIPSGEITNLPYLEAVSKLKKKIILSTGMAALSEVEQVVKLFQQNGCTDLTLLHCTTEYPAPYDEVNLRAMCKMGDYFGLPVGYSDHTQGIEIPVAAVALGATVIEKHFTLDKNMEGPDHKASLDPRELKEMVSQIRNLEKALGDGVKLPTPSELKNRRIARKSIVASRSIQKGEVLTEDNITVKRPGTGISPMQWYEVLGTKAIRNFEEDEMIER